MRCAFTYINDVLTCLLYMWPAVGIWAARELIIHHSGEKKNPPVKKKFRSGTNCLARNFALGMSPEPKYDVFLCQKQKIPGAAPPEPKNSAQSPNSDDLGK